MLNTKEDIVKLISNYPDYYDSYSILIELFSNLLKQDCYRALDAVDTITRLSNNYILDMLLDIKSAKTYAWFLNTYLKGDMYNSDEAAVAALPKQIENSDTLVKLLNNWC